MTRKGKLFRSGAANVVLKSPSFFRINSAMKDPSAAAPLFLSNLIKPVIPLYGGIF
jgi:hypothetical protein